MRRIKLRLNAAARSSARLAMFCLPRKRTRRTPLRSYKRPRSFQPPSPAQQCLPHRPSQPAPIRVHHPAFGSLPAPVLPPSSRLRPAGIGELLGYRERSGLIPRTCSARTFFKSAAGPPGPLILLAAPAKNLSASRGAPADNSPPAQPQSAKTSRRQTSMDRSPARHRAGWT